MSSSNLLNFRQLDVDSYDADLYLDDDDLVLAPTSADGDDGPAPARANITNVAAKKVVTEAEVDQIVSEVRSLLNRGSTDQALFKAISNIPCGKDPQQAKDKNLKLVMEIILATKSNDIPNILKSMNLDQVDIVMKYIYKGMSMPEKWNPALLLAWHEKLVEAGGVGSIVRVMTDRRPL